MSASRKISRPQPVWRFATVLAAATVLGAGCAPATREGSTAGGKRTSAQARHNGRTQPAAASAGARRPPSTVEDACAARLHDISGLLLEYYALNRQLPERLEELASLAETESEFAPACPVSGQPYIYLPGGLGAEGTGQRLIIYEQTPAHHGMRWVVVAAPAEGGQPPSTRVIPFTEARFRRYIGSGEVPAPVAPVAPVPPAPTTSPTLTPPTSPTSQ